MHPGFGFFFRGRPRFFRAGAEGVGNEGSSWPSWPDDVARQDGQFDQPNFSSVGGEDL